MISRIAIATADGASVCDHLARSVAFVVLEMEDGRIVSRSVRSRDSGPCGNHKSFVEMLEGCQAVICGGIGQGAFDSLTAHGIQPVVAAGACSIEDAASRHLAGTLAATGERACLCH
ncbi:MAG: NifB/NifX family molybdenum-iron cluster-binding protein [Bryobacteraceae bacterium]